MRDEIEPSTIVQGRIRLFAFFLIKFTFNPLRDLNSSLDPGGQRHESWRRGNTSRRHRPWHRGGWPCTKKSYVASTSTLKHMASSSAPQMLAPTSSHWRTARAPRWTRLAPAAAHCAEENLFKKPARVDGRLDETDEQRCSDDEQRRAF